MARIAGRNTGIELTVRHCLHALGLRYRLGGANLPGRPDLVFPKHESVVLVHGCFWHGHDCPLFRLPKTRTEFWKAKIEANRERDTRVTKQLRKLGWHCEVVWECQLRGASDAHKTRLIETLAKRITRNSDG